jgi:hypothetical protein
MESMEFPIKKRIQSCPTEFTQRAEFLYDNGFDFKFESPYFVICFCNKINLRILSIIKNKTGSGSLSYKKFYDSDSFVIIVHWSEQALIESILTCLLQNGISFITNTNLFVKFNHIHQKFYSREIEEKLATHKYMLLIDAYFNGFCKFHKSLFCLENWKTDIGKNFCKSICEILNVSPESINSF